MFGTSQSQLPPITHLGFTSEKVVVGGTILDFSTLLPTDEQIATFNNPSTGNTPVLSKMELDEDAYSPPMSAHLLPRPPVSSRKPSNLVEWLDSLFTDTSLMKALDTHSFELLKADLEGFRHEDYCEALLYAALTIADAQKRLRDVSLANPANAQLLIDFVPRPNVQENGLWMGMPMISINWNEVTGERIQHMSTMAVKSGVLQACMALHSTHSRFYKLNIEIGEQRRAMERWSAYETKHDENGEEIVTKLEVDWRDYKHIRDLERTLNSTYPIEGRYSSATDRDYILSLPDYDRESALANRAKAVAKAERNFELAKQQSYHRILKRKRDDTASIEQPSRALPANRAEALAMLHKLEGHKNKKTADPEIKKR